MRRYCVLAANSASLPRPYYILGVLCATSVLLEQKIRKILRSYYVLSASLLRPLRLYGDCTVTMATFVRLHCVSSATLVRLPFSLDVCLKSRISDIYGKKYYFYRRSKDVVGSSYSRRTVAGQTQ